MRRSSDGRLPTGGERGGLPGSSKSAVPVQKWAERGGGGGRERVKRMRHRHNKKNGHKRRGILCSGTGHRGQTGRRLRGGAQSTGFQTLLEVDVPRIRL